MVAPLAPNRIHSLPVHVSYHLQSSSQTFSTLFPTPQQVYVHPSAGLSKKVDGEDEAWGAIYLKSVVQGIVMASPEVHPQHPQTPDLSLYVLDPRETFLRRSRATEPSPRMRAASHAASSSSSSHEVWTGKGLLSWALDEPGVGKNLITGRLCRRREFNAVAAASSDGMSALEALAASYESTDGADAAWGIEIYVGLKSSISAAVGFPGPLHHTIESGQVAGVAELPPTPPRAVPTPTTAERPALPAPRMTSFPFRTPSASHLPPTHQAVASRSAGAPPPPVTSSPAPIQPAPKGKGKGGRKKKQAVAPGDTNLVSSDGIKPETMTPEQAQRLLSNPTFVSMLKNIVNAPAMTEEPAPKRARVADRRQVPHSEPAGPSHSMDGYNRCWNCNTTRSSVWRTKQIDDGNVVRVCNACGLYFNKKRVMRPDKFWHNNASSGDENKGKGKQPTTRADRMDKGFRRTLTMAAEKDAQRIANQRSARKSDGPMTSPARGSTAAPKPLRNSARLAANAPASSPGWTQPAPATNVGASTTPAADPAPPSDSPATTLRRAMATEQPTLAMPLSDDGNGPPAPSVDWNADLSAFFDVDGFAMPPANANASTSAPADARTSPHRAHTSTADMHGVSSATKLHPANDDAPSAPAQSEDDVFSELFNRTSSFFESSPTPFDFSQLPPSSPPALPSNLPHSALLYSSPGGSPLDPSPRESDCGGKVSPPQSNLRHEITPDAGKENVNEYNRDNEKRERGEEKEAGGGADDQAIQDLFSKLTAGNMSEELLALFASFPAAA